MGAFSRKSKEFIRWLSKNQYKIYDANLFNDFAIVFKSNLVIEELFVIKFPYLPFVLRFYEEPYLRGGGNKGTSGAYFTWNEEGKKLSEQGILYVIIHGMYTLKPEDIPSALLINIDRLKDRTDRYINGVRSRTFCFEDVLWAKYLEIKKEKEEKKSL
jgi:hypothetical protein